MTAADALEEARAIQEAAALRGFDWPDISGVFAKVREELGEVEEAWGRGDVSHARHEVGDLLFAVVNLARFVEAEPVKTLRDATEKFTTRLSKVDEILRQRNITMEECTIEELDAAWEVVKRHVIVPVERGLDI